MHLLGFCFIKLFSGLPVERSAAGVVVFSVFGMFVTLARFGSSPAEELLDFDLSIVSAAFTLFTCVVDIAGLFVVGFAGLFVHFFAGFALVFGFAVNFGLLFGFGDVFSLGLFFKDFTVRLEEVIEITVEVGMVVVFSGVAEGVPRIIVTVGVVVLVVT